MGMIFTCLYLFEVYFINSVYFFPKCQRLPFEKWHANICDLLGGNMGLVMMPFTIEADSISYRT